jgi:hypothetical protein
MIITNVNPNLDINSSATDTGNFQVESSIKDSKVINFFELLYSYPPKYKIKWNILDELKNDLSNPVNYDVYKHPFIEQTDDWLLPFPKRDIQSKVSYNLRDLREGFLDKRYSSTFYCKKTKSIQNALSSVPIYVVLNGLNEIVLNKPRNFDDSQTANKYLQQTIYNYCGAFDSSLEKRQQSGFFFMNRSDAETFLQEIAKSDMNGTETVGLSLHCTSLTSAYNIIREHHPGIDFRIVPDLNEVKDLLTNNLTKSSIIVENKQQQLRARRRSVNIFPLFGGLGRFLSPSLSFLQRDEYFKGVPIYIVQTLAQPRNIATTQYFNTIGLIDTIYGRFRQTFDSIFGYGHSLIMQGSIKNINDSDQLTSYVFFDETSATKFVNENRKIIAHYHGSRASNLESLVRKPKVFVYNLEDFLESWEEKIHSETSSNKTSLIGTMFNAEQILFVPPEHNSKEAQLFFESNDSNFGKRITKQVFQQVNVKYRVFKNFVGILFSIGY